MPKELAMRQEPCARRCGAISGPFDSIHAGVRSLGRAQYRAFRGKWGFWGA